METNETPITDCGDTDVGTVQTVGYWLTRLEAAEYLRVSVDTLDRWVKAGKLRRYRAASGTGRRFRRADLDAALVPEDGSAEDDGPAHG